MAEYNEQSQREKVVAGFKGGPFNKNPVSYEKLSFTNGHSMEETAKNAAQGDIGGPNLGKPWSERQGKL